MKTLTKIGLLKEDDEDYEEYDDFDDLDDDDLIWVLNAILIKEPLQSAFFSSVYTKLAPGGIEPQPAVWRPPLCQLSYRRISNLLYHKKESIKSYIFN